MKTATERARWRQRRTSVVQAPGVLRAPKYADKREYSKNQRWNQGGDRAGSQSRARNISKKKEVLNGKAWETLTRNVFMGAETENPLWVHWEKYLKNEVQNNRHCIHKEELMKLESQERALHRRRDSFQWSYPTVKGKVRIQRKGRLSGEMAWSRWKGIKERALTGLGTILQKGKVT